MKRYLAPFVFPLLFVAANATNAATYYVSAADGNDNNVGTTTQAAWKTIAKVNSATFAPGDSINFKCGELWRETLHIRASGTASQPITFGSYGDCSIKKPEIRGSLPLTGWTRHSGNIYVASISSSSDVSQLFVDGKFMRIARHPNRGFWSLSKNATSAGSCASSKAPYDAFAYSGACAIDLLLSTTYPEIKGNDFSGADIHVRSQEYWIDNNTISTHDGNGAIALNARTRFLPESGRTYYFDNKLWMLDEAGEWYFDKSKGKVYAWLPDSSDPATHTVEASTLRYGIYADAKKAAKYVVLKGLLINQASVDGVYLEGASNALIENIEVQNSRRAGILLYLSANAQIQTNKIVNSGRDGLLVRQSPNSIIKSNTVIDTGTPGFYLGSPDTSFAAIASDTSSNVSITENTVTNAAYIGIRMQIGSKISNNTINNTCLALMDCGAIYVSGINMTNTDPASVISGNIITDVGTASPTGLAAGIYLDDFANRVSVTNNTITNAERGIFLHLAHDNAVLNNTVTGSRTYSLSISENIKPSYAGVTAKNVITGNTFTQSNGKEIVNLTGFYNHINFATFSKNSYSTTNSDGIIIQRAYFPTYPVGYALINRYTLTNWQSGTGQDLSSSLIKALPSPPKAVTIGVDN